MYAHDEVVTRAGADPAALFADVAAPARRRGHGDMLDSWGDGLALSR